MTSNALSILLPYPRLRQVCGGSGVTVWAMQALLEAGHRVTLATLVRPDFFGHDRAFGTRLRELPVEVVLAPPTYRVFLKALPFPGASAEMALVERLALRLAGDRAYDRVLSTNGEMAMPFTGVQYVHYPRFLRRRPPEDYRWYHRIPGMLPAYRHALRRLSGRPPAPWRENRTLANSAFIAGLCREAGARAVDVLAPPVQVDTEGRPWPERRSRCVMIGRLHPSKRVDEMIAVLRALRQRGHALEGCLVGPWDCRGAGRRAIEEALVAEPWLEHRERLSRAELECLLAESRYGLHAMHDEHFGMGVAEMQRAGVVVFAHASGGPAEILGGRAEQLFTDPRDAVEKMDAVLRRPELALALHRAAREHRERFSTAAFRAGLVAAVEAAAPAPARSPSHPMPQP